MRFATLEGTAFALRIESYEFPDEDLAPNEDNPADEFDPSRFLIVSIEASSRDGSWSAMGPVARTSEIRRLADWLDSIAEKRHSEPGVHFTEYELEFSVSTDLAVISVHLLRDFLPPWLKTMSPDASVVLDFPVAQIDLAAASASLRRQLDRFPDRPTPGDAATD